MTRQLVKDAPHRSAGRPWIHYNETNGERSLSSHTAQHFLERSGGTPGFVNIHAVIHEPMKLNIDHSTASNWRHSETTALRCIDFQNSALKNTRVLTSGISICMLYVQTIYNKVLL